MSFESIEPGADEPAATPPRDDTHDHRARVNHDQMVEALFRQVQEHSTAFTASGEKHTAAQWLAFDEESAQLWEGIRESAQAGHAPWWAVYAAGETADRYNAFARDRRRSMEREGVAP